MNEDSKPWYKSVGVLGGLFATIGSVLALIFHVAITPGDTQELAEQTAIMGAAISGIVAIIGRIRATRTIGTAAPLLMVVLLLPTCQGCLPITATDYDRLYAAKQGLDTSSAALEAAVRNGVIKTQAQAKPLQEARDAAKGVLDDADAKLKAGDKLGFNFAFDEFNKVLGTFRQNLARANVPDPRLTLPPTPAPTPAPVTDPGIPE